MRESLLRLRPSAYILTHSLARSPAHSLSRRAPTRAGEADEAAADKETETAKATATKTVTGAL